MEPDINQAYPTCGKWWLFLLCYSLVSNHHQQIIFYQEEKMNRKNRILKTLVGVSLSLTVAFSGSAWITPAAHAAVSAPVKQTLTDRIITTGEKYLGVRYEFGAPAGRTDVFDCSSFTQQVFKENGIKLPRSSRQQAKVGTYVPKDQLKKGDLIFFWTRATGRGNIGHVGIYAGDGKVLHTYAKPYGVTYTDLDAKWMKETYITARRVLPNEDKVKLPVVEPMKQPNPADGQALRLTSSGINEVKKLNNELTKNGYKAYSKPQQWLKEGTTVSMNQLEEGDLLFFSTQGSDRYIEHAGVYVGSGKILHLSGEKKKYYSIDDNIVKKTFVTAKRYQK
jgi:cell wall-associated NlpC family hydrolase